jgi:hypothetical protein
MEDTDVTKEYLAIVEKLDRPIRKLKTEAVKPTFPNGPPISGLPPLTNYDLKIQELLSAILEKPEWWRKVTDLTIEHNWMSEYCTQTKAVCGPDSLPFHHYARRFMRKEIEKKVELWNFAIKEVREILLPQVSLPVIPGEVERTFKSHTLISQELKEALQKGLSVLADVPEDQKDWHPDSNSQVLDLIHQSLFCGVVGVTRTTLKPQNTVPWSEFIGASDGPLFTIEKEEEEVFMPVNEYEYTEELETMKWRSEKYQWLPSEFSVDEKGEVTIDSYINNLHPEKHAELYKTIAAVFQEFVPLFEKVLGNIQNLHLRPNRDRVIKKDEAKPKIVLKWGKKQTVNDCLQCTDVQCDRCRWADEDKKADSSPPSEDEEEEDDESCEYDPSEEWFKTHEIVLDFKEYKEQYLKTVGQYSLKGKKLQVIVKAANIVLAPHTKYSGGAWHVEGMKHEHIVATGIYYYHNSNIKDSFLDFRVNVQEPYHNEQDDPSVLNRFPLSQASDLNERMGSIKTTEDLCLCFPNVYQHRVREFGLENPELPGHRKILVFFLIDPEHRITSTSTVPPQQSDWLKYELGKKEKEQGVLSEFFPNDIVSEISRRVEGPMSLEEAKEHRIALMKERSVFTKDLSKKVFKRTFSLCEH